MRIKKIVKLGLVGILLTACTMQTNPTVSTRSSGLDVALIVHSDVLARERGFKYGRVGAPVAGTPFLAQLFGVAGQ